MQQVSVPPSTDSARCLTGHPSSLWWPAWPTRTHLAPRPWQRGKRPVWTNLSSCWPDPTRISVRHCRCLLRVYVKSIMIFFLSFLISLICCTSCLCLAHPLSPPAVLHFLTMLWVGKSYSHLDTQITSWKKTNNRTHKQQKQMTGLCSNQTTGLLLSLLPIQRDCSLSSPKSLYASLFTP